MKPWTKEFYEMMVVFEDVCKKEIYGKEVKRVSKSEEVPASVYYTNGDVNTMFKMFMHGIAYQRMLNNLK